MQVEESTINDLAKSREERIGISQANTLGYLSRTAIAPQKDGFFYTYVTNRSAGKVLFDNMKITRWAPYVRITYDYYPYGLTWEDPKLPSSPESIHDHCYQDKEFQWAEFTTGHGLALHDFHARMYDGATGRWLVPDPAAQFANPYLAMGNNPVVGVDPDGRFSVALSWCTGFIHGFFSKGNGRLNEAWNNANRSSSNNLKIKRGLFVTDKNKTFGGRVWELISRFTWQLPQTIGGYYTAQTYNLFQKVNWVEHEHGATVVNADGFGAAAADDGEWGGVTQGSFIVGDPTIVANANNPLFQHEYGHYLQSQEMGWGYYNRVGIPSIFSKENRHTYHPVEQDANRRAFMYFNREVDGFYTSSEEFADLGRTEGWDFQENPLGLNINGVRRSEYWDFENESRMSLLNEFSSVRAKWYDYFFWKPQIGLLNAFFYNKKL